MKYCHGQIKLSNYSILQPAAYLTSCTLQQASPGSCSPTAHHDRAPCLQEEAKLKLVETETCPLALVAQFITCLLPLGSPAWIPCCSCSYRAQQTCSNASRTLPVLSNGTECNRYVKPTKSVYLIHGAHCISSRSVHGCVARAHSPRDLLHKKP